MKDLIIIKKYVSSRIEAISSRIEAGYIRERSNTRDPTEEDLSDTNFPAVCIDSIVYDI